MIVDVFLNLPSKRHHSLISSPGEIKDDN